MSEKDIEQLDDDEQLSAELASEIDAEDLDEAEAEIDGKRDAEFTANAARKSAKPQMTPPKTKAGMISAMINVMNGKNKEKLAEKMEAIMSFMEDESVDEEDISELSHTELADYKSKGGAVKKGKPKVAQGAKTFRNMPVKITKEDLDVTTDISAVFSGSDLSEEFKSAATQIFEAAVVSKVNEKIEEIAAELEESAQVEYENTISELSTKLDNYLEYVVEEWMKENALAVESGIRSEIVEDFMVGLRNLFVENNLDIPEDKVNVVEELSTKVSTLESALSDQIQENAEMKKEIVNFSKVSVVDELVDDLTESQVEKLFSLVDSIDFIDESDFRDKVVHLKKTYFPSSATVTEDKAQKASVEDTSVVLVEEEKKLPLEPSMNAYVNAISRTAIKKTV
jgi:hypothetical protein